jgi:outer membrane receptor protein involved in Fe transport
MGCVGLGWPAVFANRLAGLGFGGPGALHRIDLRDRQQHMDLPGFIGLPSKVSNHTLVDTMIRYDLEGTRLFINATNLFDTEYATCIAASCVHGHRRAVLGGMCVRW